MRGFTIPHFLSSELDGGKYSSSRPSCLIPGKKFRHTGMAQTASLDAVEKRTISCLCQQSNHYSLILAPVAQSLTDCAIDS